MRQWIAVLMVMFLAGSVGAETGVTDDKIKVGMIADLTGPIAFVGQQLSTGASVYMQHVNDLGGVHGRKLDLIVEDDGYKPPRTVGAFHKLLDRDGVFCFVGNIGTPTTTATFPLLAREKVPLIGPGTFSSTMFDPPKRYLFGLDPGYSAQAWIAVKYIVEHQKQSAPKLAIIYQDDDIGADGRKGLHEAAAHYNVPIVAEEPFKRASIDFSTQVLNLKRSDATHVLIWGPPRETAGILKKAHTLNWHPQFIATMASADNKVVELAGPAAAQFYAIQAYDQNSDTQYVREFNALVKKYAPDTRAGFYFAVGYTSMQILVEGLKRAGRDLTREKLVAAMETFNGWQEHVGPPATYGPNLRGGSNTAAFVMKADVEKKILVRATDWIQFEKQQVIAKNGK